MYPLVDRHVCLHQLIERQTEDTPAAIAVVFQDCQLRYADLNRRANQLAHYLRRVGVGPNVFVGIHLERSPDLIVALLAVIKAGGAYVPLDPNLPAQRLAFMAQDARVSVLLTWQGLLNSHTFLADPLESDQAAANLLPEQSSTIIAIDTDALAIEQESAQNPANLVTPEDVVYVMYTSGSTGQPKGVAVPHRAVVNHNRAVSNLFELTPRDRVLQFTTFAFDAAVEEIFPTLQRGATLVLRPGNVLPSVAELYQLIATEQLTVLNLPTAYWHEWVDGLQRAPVPLPASLRLVIVGGEAASVVYLQAWQQLVGTTIQWLNTYGPTEATVIATAYKAPDSLPSPPPTVPIGRPIANVCVYVLDPQGNSVQEGEPGKLYIGGVGVSYGYINRPAATAAGFLPNPFDRGPGTRMYHTGDLVRAQHDGTLVFLGRVDNQIKIRGYRVEPDEIEAVLCGYPTLRAAVVQLREDTAGHQQLVAYIVPDGRTVPDQAELHRYLRHQLPAYMIPAVFVTLTELPLTPNGKVDRAALPAPNGHMLATRDDVTAPRTPVEELLLDLCAQVLGVQALSVDDNFLAVGGHSLLMMQLVSRLQQMFQVNVPLQAVFESASFGDLARVIEQCRTGQAGAVPPPILPQQRPAFLPLAPAQRRLWFVAQFEGHSRTYHLPFALTLRGRLQVTALEAALNAVVARHESLRTCFPMGAGDTPFQHILPAAPLVLAYSDLQDAPDEARDRWVTMMLDMPFDLVEGPLLRAALAQERPEQYMLLFVAHHSIIDGLSLDILMADVCQAYAAAVAGSAPDLPPLALQYADYTLWQATWLAQGARAAHVAYWQQQLDGAPTLLELPQQKARPPVQMFAGAVVQTPLPLALSHQLRRQRAETGLTPFMVGLAAFAALLRRYTGRNDLLIGSPIAGRSVDELNHLIGFFVNTLVLRVQMPDDQHGKDLLAHVREICLDAYAHAELPFEEIVEVMQPVRSASYVPLVQVWFAVQPSTTTTRQAGEVEWTVREVLDTTTKCDLSVELVPEGMGYQLVAEYDTALFDAPTMTQLLRHYQVVLHTLLNDPERPTARLPLLSMAEQQHLLASWKGRDRQLPEQPLHVLIQNQAVLRPQAIAVVAGAESLCYGDLETQANQLARYFTTVGVGPEDIIALAMTKSVRLVVAILATLKAGAAYLPLDPADPAARLRDKVAQAQPQMVLTDHLHPHLVAALAATPLEPLLWDAGWFVHAPAADPRPWRGHMDQLAYVMFTSGSTGRAKGVMISQRSLLNATLAWQDAYALTADDIHLQMANSAFDVFTGDLARALSSGGCLVLCTHDQLLDPVQLHTLIEHEGVTCAEFVPAVLRGLLDYLVDHNQMLTRMRLLACGSDSWDLHEYRQVRERCRAPNVQVVNSFGLTETTIDTTYYIQHASELDSTTTLPIGQPFANTHVYLLDDQLEAVPAGVVGELYIGGAGVARGYLAHPELTAVRFIPDPFSTTAGARMYRTGDKARMDATGQLAVLGRVDAQIKIRGHRVEPYELEALIKQLPAVVNALVVAGQDPTGATCLLAYVTPLSHQSTTSEDIVRAVWTTARTHLPSFVQPAAVMVLDTFPLTANGKVDRSALPEPNWTSAIPNEQPELPTVTAQLLAQIWTQLLGVTGIDQRANLFDLGGHSLLVLKLLQQIERVFGIRMPVRSMFTAPILADQASAIEQLRRAGTSLQLPPLVAVQPRRAPLPLSAAQQRLWFLAQLEGRTNTYHLPLLIAITGPYNRDRLQDAVRNVIERHESLRTCFPLVGNDPTQCILAPQSIEIAVVDLPDLDETQLQAWSLTQIEPSFDLAHGPLLRVYLAHQTPERAALLFVMHHSIVDGWSLATILRDLATCYEQALKGGPPVPSAPLQYADYTLWQRTLKETTHWQSGIAYWRAQLEDLPAALPLPEQRPRSVIARHSGQVVRRTISPHLAAAVSRISAAQSVTPFMIFLTAFQLVRYRYTGQADLAVGSPTAGRNHEALTDMVGFFVNTLVLRTRLVPGMRVREVLVAVRDVCLDAYLHDEIPFDHVVEVVRPDRTANQFPLVQHLFAVQPADPEVVRIGATHLQILPTLDTVAKCDLSIEITPQAAGWIIDAEYDVDLFDGVTIERLLDHYITLLTDLVARPAARIDELAVLTPGERQMMVEEGNKTSVPYPATETVSTLFEAQAARTPEAIALHFPESTRSYRSLNAEANRLARMLRGWGVGCETPVALYFERSPDLIVAILAVLKAGGIYVPLDPSYPAARVRMIFDDTVPHVLMSRKPMLDQLAQTNAEMVDRMRSRSVLVDLDGLTATLATYDASNLVPIGTGASLAYQMYTSGSTGRPKGIAVPHRAIIRLVHQANYAQFDRHVRMAHVSNIAFDAATFEIWGALLHGGQLISIPNETVLHPAAFAAALRQHGITTMFLTVALFNHLIRSQPDAFVGVQEVLFGGDAADPTSVRLAKAHNPGTTLVNAYGPTENTTFSTYYRVNVVASGVTTIPIGGPIRNSEAYVLDALLQPVPVGVVGELYVGGAGLARYYVNQPGLTAERFVPHPFSRGPGERLYRTGDMVQRGADGAIIFLGRHDQQVKIRGHRIELGEIEALLAEHAAVHEVAVIAHRSTPPETQLVAYIVLSALSSNDTPQTTQLHEVRQFAQAHLPAYMVPVVWVPMERLPLTPNGKVDRATLPAPNGHVLTTMDDVTTPRNPLEQLLAAIWSDVFATPITCVYAEFFALGGHSLQATRLLARVAELCRIDLPLRVMFEGISIAKMAELLIAHDPHPGQVLNIAALYQRINHRDNEEPLEGPP